VGIGFPLLALGALGLARHRPWVTLVTAILFSSTLLVAVRFVLGPGPYWFTPRGRALMVEALRAECRSGDRVFGPQDISLFAFGTTRCQAFLSHAISPEYLRRRVQLEAFARLAPEARAALLDSTRMTLLVLPGDPGPLPRPWLPESSAWKRVATVGSGPDAWSVYRRGQP
jgi:hypothetical protein